MCVFVSSIHSTAINFVVNKEYATNLAKEQLRHDDGFVRLILSITPEERKAFTTTEKLIKIRRDMRAVEKIYIGKRSYDVHDNDVIKWFSRLMAMPEVNHMI